MSEDMAALGRRAVACRAWRWEPGMLDTQGRRAVDEHEIPAWHDDGTSCEPYNASGVYEPRGDALPVLSDPATLGCLLALVREAWGDPYLCVVRERDAGWILADSLCSSLLAGDRYFRGITEAEALVAALEAAPVRS